MVTDIFCKSCRGIKLYRSTLSINLLASGSLNRMLKPEAGRRPNKQNRLRGGFCISGANMVWLRHKGCKTPIVEYIGKIPLYKSPIMRARDWIVMGKKFNTGDCMPRFNCPNCGQRTGIHVEQLETCDGSPYRYMEKPKEVKKQTIFDRLMAVFSFKRRK